MADAAAIVDLHLAVPDTVRIIITRLLLQDPTASSACALHDGTVPKSVGLTNCFAYTAVACSSLPLFDHIVVAPAAHGQRKLTPYFQSMCEAAIGRAMRTNQTDKYCIVAFPTSPEAQAVAEAALRLLGLLGALHAMFRSSRDECLFFHAIVAQRDERLNAIMYEFTPVEYRLGVVFDYMLVATVPPEGIPWEPLFTAASAPDFLRHLAAVNFSFSKQKCWRTVVVVAQLWERCGMPHIVELAHFWFNLVQERTPEEAAAPETPATTLLRQSILYIHYTQTFQERRPAFSSLEYMEACIVIAGRRSERLLTHVREEDVGTGICEGARAAEFLATYISWGNATERRQELLDCLFASPEAQDPVFLAGLQVVMSEDAEAPNRRAIERGRDVSSILSQCVRWSRRSMWIKLCIQIGLAGDSGFAGYAEYEGHVGHVVKSARIDAC